MKACLAFGGEREIFLSLRCGLQLGCVLLMMGGMELGRVSAASMPSCMLVCLYVFTPLDVVSAAVGMLLVVGFVGL